MSKLLLLRQKLNLTQEELSDRTGISVRTIQRIEAGTIPKGYTLKTLAKGLRVNEEDLVDAAEEVSPNDTKWLKLINLSVLPFILLPPLNIFVPLLIMYFKKQFNPLTRRLVTLQIVWTLLIALFCLTVVILNDWFGIRSNYLMLAVVALVLANIFVILLNAAQLDKDKRLRISINFSLI